MCLDEEGGSGDRLAVLERRIELLKALEFDMEAAPLLRSIAKARLEFLVQRMEQGNAESEVITELIALIFYLSYQGEVSDIAPLERLIPLFPKVHPLSAHVARWTDVKRQRLSFEGLHAFALSQAKPQWRVWADLLIDKGYDTEESLGLTGAAQRKEMAVPPIQQALAPVANRASKDATATVQSGLPSSLIQWALLIVLAAAISAFVFLVAIRHNRHSRETR
jgi:hypothetical protein